MLNSVILVYVKIILMLIVAAMLTPAVAQAQTSSSNSYRVTESGFSSGSNIDANSASYNAWTSIGDLAVGSADSANYNARPGFITPNEEFLDFVVQTTDVDLGLLDTSLTRSGSATFYVRSYVNGDYAVYSMSSSPESESGADLDPLTAAAVSTIGTEQFGFNLVSNATPSVGLDPIPDPTTDFANGEAAPGYDTADNYKSLSGDVIARSGSVGPAWGRTNFTISYIANISPITPAGSYSMAHDLVVTATF